MKAGFCSFSSGFAAAGVEIRLSGMEIGAIFAVSASDNRLFPILPS